MKLAILLYGHLRTFEECASSLLEFVTKGHDVDIFIHTWDETESRTKTYYKSKNPNQKVDDKTLEKINSLYRPKKLKVEKQEFLQDKEFALLSNSKVKISTVGIHFMMHSLNESNKLRELYQAETDTEYDLVLCTRPDIEFFSPLNMDKILSQSKIIGLDEETSLYTACNPCGSQDDLMFIENLATDLIMLGKPETVNKFIQVNQNLTEDFICKHFLNPETLFLTSARYGGIQTNQINYLHGINFKIKRHIKKKTGLLRIKVKPDRLKLHFLTNLSIPLIHIKSHLLFHIFDFCIGKPIEDE